MADRFPQFEILECLGRGGMGVVYHAKHLRLDVDVAVKCMHPRLSQDEDFLKRFQREARSAASISRQSP